MEFLYLFCQLKLKAKVFHFSNCEHSYNVCQMWPLSEEVENFLKKKLKTAVVQCSAEPAALFPLLFSLDLPS